MKKGIILSISFLCSIFLFAQEEVEGKWKTFNDEGEVRSIMEVFEEDGKIHAKVYKIINEEKRDDVCKKCKGEDKNKKIEGLVLMKNMEKEGDEYVNGTITNPDNGKIYDSKIWLDEDNPDILKVRGYIGFFHKTLSWERMK